MYLDRKPPWCRCNRLVNGGLDRLCEEKIRHKGVAENLRLRDVTRRIHKELELQIGDLVDVQVETLELDRPGGHFAISRKNLHEN